MGADNGIGVIDVSSRGARLMEAEYDLYLYVDCIVDSFGFGYLSFGPEQAWERWEIASTQISNNGANASKLEIFNNAQHTQLVEGTWAGRLDTTDTNFKLRTGEKLFFRWGGASTGSRSTATIRGRKFVGR